MKQTEKSKFNEEEKRELAEHCKNIGWVETSPGIWEAPPGWKPK